MTNLTKLLVATWFCLFTAPRQSLEPSHLLKPVGNDWPTYSGDYSSRRYSSLTQINQSNVKHLTLAWATRVTAGAGNAAGGGRGGGRGGGPAATVIISGEGNGVATTSGRGGVTD